MRRIFVSFSFVVCMLCMTVCLNSCGDDDDEKIIKENGSGEGDNEEEEQEQEENDDSINVLDKIKDPVFKYDIEIKIKQGVLKVATPGILKPSEAATLKIFSVIYSIEGKRIASLEGIEYFTGIEKLYVNNSGIELIDLSKNLKVTEINIYDCTAESIKIISPTAKQVNAKYAQCKSLNLDTPQLTYLDCNDTRINILNTSGCPKLERLRCGGSKIISLDLSSNTELWELSCGGAGNISSGVLDISKNKKLRILYAGMGALYLRTLYVWWDGGRDNIPSSFEKFFIESRTNVIKKD